MSDEVYQAVSSCAIYARTPKLTKLKRLLHFFPTSGPLDLETIYILGPLPPTRKGKRIHHSDNETIPEDEKSDSNVKNDGYACSECVRR